MKEINQAYFPDKIVSHWCFGQEFNTETLQACSRLHRHNMHYELEHIIMYFYFLQS